MSSPKIVQFAVLAGDGVTPLPGQTPTFTTYQDSDGTPLLQPTFTDRGGGAYEFTPVFTVNKGIFYILDTDVGGNPKTLTGYLRPEDYNIDNLVTDTSTLATAAALATAQSDITNIDTNVSTLITDVASVQSDVTALGIDVTALKKIETNKWKVFTSGPDANRLVIYDDDDTTPLYKFDLVDSTGAPTVTNPFARTPV